MPLGLSFCGGGMIGGKRRSLLKQLWKHHQDMIPSPPINNPSRDRTLTAKAALRALSKRLKDRQLETLVQALDGTATPSLGCVLVSRADVLLPEGTRLAPQVVACQLWRWPAVEEGRRLRVLPICSSASYSSSSSYSSSLYSSLSSDRYGVEAGLCCCNPFHWSTTIPEETSLSALLSDSTEDHQEIASYRLDKDITDSRQWQTPWCHLIYREYNRHIGGFFPIYGDWTRVFQDLFHGDGMCLSLIQKPTTSRPVDRTRSKIGRGILLSRQNNTIWMFNCSEHPIFVCSPSLFEGVVPHGSWKFLVRRIPPGCSLKVYDCAVVDQLLSLVSKDGVLASKEGPVYLDSIHISFVKGWGRQYTRQFITSCPCWMEILLRRK